MAKLITNHDPYHIHKVLGVVCLLHYVYRYYLLFKYGNCFPTETQEPTWQACALVALHGLLSCSSLLLPLPQKRNFTQPMIWPEFRLHSILFAMRHVVATLISLTMPSLPHKNIMANFLIRSFLVLGTVKVASYIADEYGCQTKRTTNTMPYPAHVTEELQKGIKRQYMLAQFSATVGVLSPDASLNFAPLLGIQIAPLMMTLVRKGKASATSYHWFYAMALMACYLVIFGRMHSVKALGVSTCIMGGIPLSKIRRIGMSPIFLWGYFSVFALVIYPIFAADKLESIFPDEWHSKMVGLCALKVYLQWIWNIVPIFVNLTVIVSKLGSGEVCKKNC